MAAGWIPQEEATAKICSLFSEYQHPGSNQSQVLAQLERCRAFPDFNNYLALILAQGTSLQLEIRQSAGLLLKNNLIRQYVGTPPDYQEYIKASLLLAIDNEARALRHVVGTNVATIVAADGLGGWPQLLPSLVRCLQSDSVAAIEGALDALSKVLEDAPPSADRLDQLVVGVVPHLLALFCSPHSDVKRRAVGVMNQLAAGAAGGLGPAMETYRLGLFSLARDPSPGVRRAVCGGLVQLLHLQPEALVPQMRDIIEYMLESSQDEDDALALEACEFWSAFADSPLEPALLAPHLPRLVPLLLKNMVYDEFDEEVVDTEAAEAGQAPDNDADVRPFHHRNSEGEGMGKDSACWNIRKCSAAGLDVLSTVFGEELLPFVTPTVRQRLQDEDWRARESAILALGAISEGCHRGLVPYIGELVGLLAPALNDARPLVRSITCWTLSRYAHWVVANGQDPHSLGQLQFDLVIEGLLGRVLDRNKHVQEAACSALATLEEQAGPELLPRLRVILETLAQATLVYGRRNVRMLYDALSTLAEAVGRALAEPSLLAIFMPPLLAKWGGLADSDAELLPLMECFMTIATAIGPAFEEYAEATFQRCMRILSTRLLSRQMAAKQQEAGDPEADLDYVVCSLDAMSGVAEALGFRFEGLLSASAPAPTALRDILLQCCQDASADIRQSAFALVGDLVKVCAPYLGAALTELVALSIANLEAPAISPATMSACNNACWSLGELAIKQRSEDLAPFAAPIAERLVPILSAGPGQMPRSLVENAAITLGRIAWVCPAQVAPHLEHFLAPWCSALRLLNDGVEKEHAFQGLCCTVRHNPQAAAASFKSIVEAVLSWQTLHNEALAADILQILNLHKAELTDRGQWQPYLATLSPAVRDKMLAMLQHG